MNKKKIEQITKELSKYAPNNRKVDKLLIKNFIHKKTSSFFPGKFQNLENNCLSENNFNKYMRNVFNKSVKSNFSHYSNVISKEDNKKEVPFSYRRNSSLNPNLDYLIQKHNFLSSDVNKMNFTKKSTQQFDNNLNLPDISNMELNRTSYRLKNNNKMNKNYLDEIKKGKKLSSQMVFIPNMSKSRKELNAQSEKKYLKMKTNYDIGKKIEKIASEFNLMKTIEKEGKNQNEEKKEIILSTMKNQTKIKNYYILNK